VNADFGDQLHFVAAEPHTTFLRVGVADNGSEVAYEIAILGRLRRGYRVLQLRGPRGTRIELCCLFVRVMSGDEPHLWPTPSQLRLERLMAQARMQRTMAPDSTGRLSVVTENPSQLKRSQSGRLSRLSTQGTTERLSDSLRRSKSRQT